MDKSTGWNPAARNAVMIWPASLAVWAVRTVVKADPLIESETFRCRTGRQCIPHAERCKLSAINCARLPNPSPA